jgi:putative serine protease PepD
MQPPKALLTLTAAALLGAGGGAAVVAVAGDGHTSVTTIETTREPATRIADRAGAGASTAAQVYTHAKDSVAYITADVSEQSDSPTGESQQGEATGTGFVVDAEGLIVTNAHVVEGATAISVKVGDGATHPATVVGRDASTDLALLRVDGGGGAQTFTPLQLGDSSKLEVGDATYAIGNPYGLDRTLTTGVVSALQRQISAPNGFSIDGVIQTDAPINPGNSGGPLLDAAGRVIGVNSQILTGSGSSQSGNVGIGFAVPSNTVRTVVTALEAGRQVEHAYLGVQTADSESGTGAQVGAVSSGGPAEQAGLQAGDTVLAVDGTALSQGAASLSAAVNAHQPGDHVELTIRRDGGERTVSVTLGTQPQQAASATGQDQQP